MPSSAFVSFAVDDGVGNPVMLSQESRARSRRRGRRAMRTCSIEPFAAYAWMPGPGVLAIARPRIRPKRGSGKRVTILGPQQWLRKSYADLRGFYRVFAPAVYRFYRKQDTPPVPGTDAVWCTSATLPYTPTDTFADGVWYVCTTYFNGILESAVLATTRIDVSGGAATYEPPSAPQGFSLVRAAGGVVRVEGYYHGAADGDLAATGWAIWYTTNGVDPNPSGTPDYVGTFLAPTGFSVLQQSLPAQVHGTTIKALLRTRRDDGTGDPHVEDWTYSENATILSTTADATGPTVPYDGEIYPGRLPEGV